MTLDTAVRFLAPIDPRDVFAFCAGILEAPEDYRVFHTPPGCGRGLAGWPLNPQLHAEAYQGLNALLYVEYGKEGSLLIDEWQVYAEEYPEDYPEDQRPPAAYVEASFDTAYGYDDEFGRSCGDLHAEYITALTLWTPVPIQWQLEYDGSWHTPADALGTLGKVDMERAIELAKKGRAALAKGHLRVDAQVDA